VRGTVRFSHYGGPDQVVAPLADTVKPVPVALRQWLEASTLF
jgi:hypothetical protein